MCVFVWPTVAYRRVMVGSGDLYRYARFLFLRRTPGRVGDIPLAWVDNVPLGWLLLSLVFGELGIVVAMCALK